MNRLRLITAYFLSLGLFAAEQMDSYAENVRLIMSGKSEGNGIILARVEYDAVINIERFAGSAEHLMAHLAAWLMSADAVDDENPPRLDIELTDDQTVDVEISVHFEEAINLVQDAAGDIELDGLAWRLVEAVPIDTAETGDVENLKNA